MPNWCPKCGRIMFLLYSPLNQGLKRFPALREKRTITRFLLYSPLNQGLKLNENKNIDFSKNCFYSTVH